jgi:hypothetical protein
MARQARLANHAVSDGLTCRDSGPDTVRQSASRTEPVRWHVGPSEYIVKISKKGVDMWLQFYYVIC